MLRSHPCPGLVAALPLVWLTLSAPTGAATPSVAEVLKSLRTVHSFGEVAISPDGKHVLYGRDITARRADADVDVSGLWVADA